MEKSGDVGSRRSAGFRIDIGDGARGEHSFLECIGRGKIWGRGTLTDTHTHQTARNVHARSGDDEFVLLERVHRIRGDNNNVRLAAGPQHLLQGSAGVCCDINLMRGLV